jgi:hypothetical protein
MSTTMEDLAQNGQQTDVRQEIDELKKTQAVQAATEAGAQATQAATTAGLGVAVASGAAGLVAGMLLGSLFTRS